MSARETTDLITTWFDEHLPADLYAGTATVVVDRDEVVVVGDVPEPGDVEPAAAIADFRERTRDQRMGVAARAEEAFGRTVSWGARAGDTERMSRTIWWPRAVKAGSQSSSRRSTRSSSC